ncbi:TetR/AcrR family transcriptional regulator [Promicromonospora sp. NPDC057138]|uniref:TetR/AcrR family transcriptional regulator n=1 Tax=Promicromonospora sp. NPDC057138 TaxID=3346031 RepID=UPI003632EFA9
MKESTPPIMSPDRPAGPARARRPRGSITAAAILDAAEQLAAEGIDAVTVRAVTSRLHASPMAFYRHFATKEALVDALLDRVLGRFQPPPATEDWVEDLRSFGLSHRRILQDHPWAVTPLFGHPSPGLNAVRIGESALGILHRGGVTGDRAVAIFSGIIALNYGWSAFTTAQLTARPAAGNDEPPALRDVLAALPVDEFPLTVAVADSMGGFGTDLHYGIALDQLLAGVSLPQQSRVTRADGA